MTPTVSPKPLTNATRIRPLDLVLATIGLLCIIVASGLLIAMTTGADSTTTTLIVDPTTSPKQDMLWSPDPIIVTTGETIWTVQPQASYTIAARVLSKKTYVDWESPLVPLDLALGWGEMSNTAVDEWITWRQSGRWYHYQWSADSPYNGSDIRDQSANTHIIPANDNLLKALRNVSTDDAIWLEGYLVDVTVDINGRSQHIPTSLSRRDTGNGGCEVLYVTTLVVNGRLYE